MLLHVCDQARLKSVNAGVIIMCLYLCSITSCNTVRLVISSGPAWHKSAGNPASVDWRGKQPSVAGCSLVAADADYCQRQALEERWRGGMVSGVRFTLL